VDAQFAGPGCIFTNFMYHSFLCISSFYILFCLSKQIYIRSTYIIKAVFLNGSVSYFTNGVSCAKALHVSNTTITQRLNDGKPVKNKDGLTTALTIKRIKAYSPKSFT
jgi:hypothetical protein